MSAGEAAVGRWWRRRGLGSTGVGCDGADKCLELGIAIMVVDSKPVLQADWRGLPPAAVHRRSTGCHDRLRLPRPGKRCQQMMPPQPGRHFVEQQTAVRAGAVGGLAPLGGALRRRWRQFVAGPS